MNTMEFLMAILNWLQTDPSHVIVAASVIAAVIPTPAPNTPWGRVYKMIDVLALNVIHAKETGVDAVSVAQEVAAILAKQPAAPVAAVSTPAPASPAPAGIQPTP